MTDRATFTRFEDSTKAEWDNIMQCMKHTQSLVPDRILEQLRHLESDHGGFPVSRLEHSLQTATRAMRCGEKDEYVACALIHDIGDLSYMIETHTKDTALLARADALLERRQAQERATP